MWLMRIQLSDNGIHRPPVAGIHANEKDGAMSIVLNGSLARIFNVKECFQSDLD